MNFLVMQKYTDAILEKSKNKAYMSKFIRGCSETLRLLEGETRGGGSHEV
jgi:hypothetical protein